MKITKTTLYVAGFMAAKNVGVNADGEVISSWVQYTGKDMDECVQMDGAMTQSKDPFCHFTAEVRAIVNDTMTGYTECPDTELVLEVNGELTPMKIRDVDGVKVTANDNFPNIVCFAELPTYEGVDSIMLNGESLPTPKWDNEKVAVIGDSGCCLGTSHGGLYQSCLNPSLWPFATVAQSVADENPDLILHTGDYIYREGPCTTYKKYTNGPGDGIQEEIVDGITYYFTFEEIAGCKGSPFYDSSSNQPPVPENFGVWYADWFEPAASINKAAPLILMRGNHEQCQRAGTGFFRYLHHNETVCNTSPGPRTEPFVIDFKDFQVGITDNSKSPSLSDQSTIDAFAGQLNFMGDYFTKPALFGAHYPYYGWGADDDDITGEGGSDQVNPGMQAVANATKWGRLPPSFDLLLGSHIHLTQITTFEDSDGMPNPPQLVVGNSGTQFVAPTEALLQFGNKAKGLPIITVKDTYNFYQYGSVLVTKVQGDKKNKKNKKNKRSVKGGDSWVLELKDQNGRSLLECGLKLYDVHCYDVDTDWTATDAGVDVTKAQMQDLGDDLITQVVTPNGGGALSMGGSSFLLVTTIFLFAVN